MFWFICFDVWLPKRKEQERYWQEEKKKWTPEIRQQPSTFYLDAKPHQLWSLSSMLVCYRLSFYEKESRVQRD